MNYESFFDFLAERNLREKFSVLESAIERSRSHGDYEKFISLLDKLPSVKPSTHDFNFDAVKVGSKKDLTEKQKIELEDTLRNLIPWRKGPFDLFDVFIDSEWRSNLKWDRIKNAVSLKDKFVLDVGSGNGYYCWRMLGKGASAVIGIDPYLLSVVQFHAVKKYLPDYPLWVLPVGVEEMSDNLELFDVVFSMGVLYHRRSPFEHLFKLKSFLKEGGKLILETLVIEGKENEVLVPQGRYAKMRNVWFIPSPVTLQSWLKRAGFKHIELIDVSKTTISEQRKTDWMPWESLEDFLDPNDNEKTIEGYPAPRRAVFVCEK